MKHTKTVTIEITCDGYKVGASTFNDVVEGIPEVFDRAKADVSGSLGEFESYRCTVAKGPMVDLASTRDTLIKAYAMLRAGDEGGVEQVLADEIVKLGGTVPS